MATKTKDGDVKRELSDEDRDLLKRHKEAKDNAKAWTEVASELQEQLEQRLGNITVGLIDNKDAVTYRYKDAFAKSRFVKDHPELAKHYMQTKVVEVLDDDLIRRTLPDMWNEYRVRELRNVFSG